jgi:hypothetical protein
MAIGYGRSDPVNRLTASAGSVNRMPRPKVYASRTVGTKLEGETLVWLIHVADDLGVSVSECLRHIVEAARAAGAPIAVPVHDSLASGQVGVTRRSAITGHPFTPQSGNPLRCGVCGQRKAAH